MSKMKQNSGLSFIEVMVAITVLLIGILGVFSTITATHNASKRITDKNTAARKLQTVMEIVQAVPFGDVMATVPPGQINFDELIDYNSSLPKSTTAVLRGPNNGDAMVSVVYTDDNFNVVTQMDEDLMVLFVTAAITWQDRSAQFQSLTMTTVKSR